VAERLRTRHVVQTTSGTLSRRLEALEMRVDALSRGQVVTTTTWMPGRIAASEPREAALSGQAPRYRLPRDVRDVSALWQLWMEGAGGMPSVEALERRWGPAWRRGDAEFYSTRRTIIEEVRRRAAAQGLPAPEIARRMDAARGKGTLNQLYKLIRFGGGWGSCDGSCHGSREGTESLGAARETLAAA
jgi:hypothetical protein